MLRDTAQPPHSIRSSYSRTSEGCHTSHRILSCMGLTHDPCWWIPGQQVAAVSRSFTPPLTRKKETLSTSFSTSERMKCNVGRGVGCRSLSKDVETDCNHDRRYLHCVFVRKHGKTSDNIAVSRIMHSCSINMRSGYIPTLQRAVFWETITIRATLS